MAVSDTHCAVDCRSFLRAHRRQLRRAERTAVAFVQSFVRRNATQRNATQRNATQKPSWPAGRKEGQGAARSCAPTRTRPAHYLRTRPTRCTLQRMRMRTIGGVRVEHAEVLRERHVEEVRRDGVHDVLRGVQPSTRPPHCEYSGTLPTPSTRPRTMCSAEYSLKGSCTAANASA